MCLDKRSCHARQSDPMFHSSESSSLLSDNDFFQRLNNSTNAKNGSVDDLRPCETSQSGEIISQFSVGPCSPHAPRQSIM
jgi:hypothetical protein